MTEENDVSTDEVSSDIEVETKNMNQANPEGDSWAFIGTAPTYQEAFALLESIPPIYGVKTSDFTDHILPLAQNTKVEVNGNTEWKKVWRLYMTVAGRVAMVQKACEINGWQVDFSPEQSVPEGNPAGFIFTEPHLVYREFCNIYTHDDETGEVVFLGSKPGMSQAKGGNNAYEKVETAARGRSIAAWGFGVLPGSGIASLEEMESVKGADVGTKLSGRKRSKGELLTSVNDLMKTLEKVKGNTADTVEPKILGYINEAFGKDSIAELADGQLILLEKKIRASIAQDSD